MAGKVGTAYVDTELDPSGIRKGLQQVEGETKTRMGTVRKDLKAGFEKAFVPATVALGAVAVGAKKAIDAASDLAESQNAVRVTFGRSAKAVLDFSEKAATKAGLSMREFNELVTPVGASLRNAGLGADEAAKSSIALTKRAADMASVFNTSVPEALQAIQAGLRGEADPLERFGVGLSDAAVKAKAAAMGLKTQHGELDAHAKAQARMALLMEQTNRLQGDFENTSDGAANQQRILHAQMENVSAELGKALLPAFTQLVKMLGKLVGLIARHQTAFKILVSVFTAFAAAIVAVNLAMKAYAAGTVIVKAAVAAWTAVQWLLNAALSANPIGLVVIALTALVAGLVLAYQKSETFRDIVDAAFEAVLDVANEVADFFTDDIPAAFQAVLDWVKKYWPAIAILIAGPFAPLVILAGDGFGIRTALQNAITGLISWIKGKASALYNAGADLGRRLKQGVVDAVTGIGNAVWAVVDNIRARIGQGAQTIIGWGKSVGGWVKQGVVDGLVGIGLGAWGLVDNVWQMLNDNSKTIIGWGKSVGGWLKAGILAALKGLKDAIKSLLRKALPGPLEKIAGLRSAAPVPGPAPAPQSGLRAAAGPQAAGTAGGGLAGPAPVGYQLRRALSGLTPAAAAAGQQPLEVRVFIGDTELRGIVRTEVRTADNRTAQTLLAGAH
ncbi:MAG TPA: phage tail tape measure protein [Solirubrobacteraceae bacterium]|nr:phage tail tape measure protein [Solirubrobacteraceae bacterium]